MYNAVHDNGGVGLYIQAGNGTVVNFNNLNNNAGAYELQNGGAASVNALYNYWGALIISEMAIGVNPKNITRIYAIYDDTGKGAAVYGQWLSEAVTLPGTIVSNITAPVDGSSQKNQILEIDGIAVSPAGVSYVEISPDSGLSWYRAEGGHRWHLSWPVAGDGGGVSSP